MLPRNRGMKRLFRVLSKLVVVLQLMAVLNQSVTLAEKQGWIPPGGQKRDHQEHVELRKTQQGTLDPQEQAQQDQ